MTVNFDFAQIITIISIGLVVFGWFINQWLSRKNEIAKELRIYRLDMLQSIIDFTDFFRKNDASLNSDITNDEVEQENDENLNSDSTNTLTNDEVEQVFEKVGAKILLYGKKDEIDSVYRFLDARGNFKYNNDNNAHAQFKELVDSLTELVNLCRNKIRKELNLKNYKEKK